MLFNIFLVILLATQYTHGQLENYKQKGEYITVREGAHIFYWLLHTTAPVQNYTERPLLIWLQGGVGASSTGEAIFDMIGPLTIDLQERNETWIKSVNLMFVDSPVGTGYSYVEDTKLLTKTSAEIVSDLMVFLRGFYRSNPEFEAVPVYLYGYSYSAKIAVDLAIELNKAVKEGTMKSNLVGLVMASTWNSPVDAVLSWPPLLKAIALVEDDGFENIQESANETVRLFNNGQYVESTDHRLTTLNLVANITGGMVYQHIFATSATSIPDTRKGRRNIVGRSNMRDNADPLDILMNTQVKKMFNIPEELVWTRSSDAVFDAQKVDFMKPATDSIEKLLNETNIVISTVNGNYGLLCNTPAQIAWISRLKWAGAEQYKKSPRQPIWENNRLQGYYKGYGNFNFYAMNAGHMSPRDNPEGMLAVLRDITSY
ncbi:retinoid-inducible serine carboxypeptidase-like [Battus philenor]|uniref:retinoid-inducible serine carboxypeptidase-like n=1 Tax=Battus philenor TaxID=42288 RepID=UPI0035D0EDD2